MKDDGMIKSLKELDNLPDFQKKGKSKVVGGTVCRYFLENRCKFGDNCEYLHEYDPSKYPECPYAQYTFQNNTNLTVVNCQRGKDCIFKHTPRQIKECQNYANGYCKDGNNNKLLKSKLLLSIKIFFFNSGVV